MSKKDYSLSIYKKNVKPAPQLEGYLNWRKLSGYTDSYSQSIIYSVNLFIRFVGKYIQLSEVTNEHMDLFIVFLRDKEYATSTIKLYLTHINCFLGYMRSVGMIEYIPKRTLALRMTEAEKMVDVRYLTSDEVISIRQAAAAPPTRKQNLWTVIRHKLVIELLISTGMRKSELPTILVKNVDLGERRMKIYGKKNSHTRRNNGKSGWRIVPLTSHAVTYIKEWLTVRPDVDDVLLPGYKARDANYTVQSTCVRAGLIKDGFTNKSWVGPHKFRHYFATTLYLKGVAIDVIADQMGDEISTLSSYIHAEREHDTAHLGDLME